MNRKASRMTQWAVYYTGRNTCGNPGSVVPVPCPADWTCQVCQHESVAGVARLGSFSIAYIMLVVCYVPGLGLATVGLLWSAARAEMSTDRTGSDWIRTEANFGQIMTGSDCNFLKIGWSGLDRTEKTFVVLMWLFWKYQNFSCDPISQVC